MGSYLAAPAVDDDLLQGAQWIALDNPEAAVRFLDTARRNMEFLSDFPEAGPKARLKPARLQDMRFWVLSPPFNKWIMFYKIESGIVVVIRILHSAQNWRGRAEELF